MKVNTKNEDFQRRYLLGDCTDAEIERVEAEFLSNDGLFDGLAALEDELYLDYAAGELTAPDKAAFEARFLRTRDDRRRLAFADAFVATTAEMADSKATLAVGADEPRSMLVSLAAFFVGYRSAVSYGMAAAVLLLALSAGFLLVQNAGLRRDVASLDAERVRERQEQERVLAEKQSLQAELERQLNEMRDQSSLDDERIAQIESQRRELQRQIDKGREKLNRLPSAADRHNVAPGRSPIVALVLAPGFAARAPGETDPNQVTLPPKASRLALTLQIRQVDAFPLYRVVVQSVDNGTVAFASRRLNAGKSGISLSIPASRLAAADYKAILIGVRIDGSEEEQTRYYFSVTR